MQVKFSARLNLHFRNLHIATGLYFVKGGERSNLAIELNKAEELFNQHCYKEARNALNSMASPTLTAQSLYAWVA